MALMIRHIPMVHKQNGVDWNQHTRQKVDHSEVFGE